MSQLKYVFNVLLLSAVITGLAACDNDGAFKAADLSIKEVPQDRPVLTEEQIKALYDVNQAQVQELRQEIALKNEALSLLESNLASATSELNALSQKMLELIASDQDADAKAQEMLALRAQINALHAQIESDREQYVEALGTVDSNERVLIAELVRVREEINRLKDSQGSITDEEILAIYKNITEQIERLAAEQEEKRIALEAKITELEQQGGALRAEVSALETAAAAAQTEEERARLEAELLAAKEREVQTQTELNEAVEEYNDVSGNLVTIRCEEPSDCEQDVDGSDNTTDVVKTSEDLTTDTAVPVSTAEVAEAIETTEVLEPVQTTEVLEPVEDSDDLADVSSGTETANPMAEVEARRARNLEQKAAEIEEALATKNLLLQNLQELKDQLAALQKDKLAIDNELFDILFNMTTLSSDEDKARAEEEQRAKQAEARRVLDEMTSVNNAISQLQDQELVQAEERLKELRRQRIDLMRR